MRGGAEAGGVKWELAQICAARNRFMDGHGVYKRLWIFKKKKSNIKKSANPLVVADFFVTLQANKGDFSSYPKSMRCMRHTGEATEKRFYFLYILMMCIKFPSLLHLTFISTR